MLCLRSPTVHEDMNPDLSAPSCTLYSISMFPSQPWRCLGFFQSHCSLTLGGCLSHLPISLPLTSQMLGQPGAPPAPQAPGTGSALAALRAMSALLVFLGGKKRKKYKLLHRQLYPIIPFTIPSLETSNPLAGHLLPCSYLSQADPAACSTSLVVLRRTYRNIIDRKSSS